MYIKKNKDTQEVCGLCTPKKYIGVCNFIGVLKQVVSAQSS